MYTGEDRSGITPEEYYRLEATAPEKSDWFDFELLNMAGGTTNYSRIKTNLSRTIGNKLADGLCEPLDSDQRLVIHETWSADLPGPLGLLRTHRIR
ncbi:MAG: hypothetical protein KDN18_25470 [Verrucomicrobiae bacterium]|nr:hypothetical protein [Verrucomicrobiae bacterium]